MDRRRTAGVIALVVLVAVIAALVYFDARTARQAPQTAFAPAQSADESAPADETPIEPPPPATLAEKAPAELPAAEVPAATTPAPAASGPEVAMVNPAEPPPATAAPVMPGTPVVPTFDVVRVEPSGETVIAGQAEPEATVEVLDGPVAIATAEANERGEWVMALDKPLTPGSHDLAVRTTSKDKKVATLSDQRVTVSVPEPGSKDVLVVLNTPDAASRVLEVPDATAADKQVASAAPVGATEEKPTAEPQVAMAEPPTVEAPIATEPPVALEPKVALEAPVATEPAVKAEPPIAAEPPVTVEPPKPEVTVAAVEADTAGSVYIAGTVATGETVRVYIDGEPIGEAQPSPSGTWLVQTTRNMPAGNYTVRADQIDAGGNVIARSEVPFEREVEVAILTPNGTAGAAGAESGATLAGEMPAMETVIIKRGDNLWRIARGAWGKGIRWSTIYQANTDQIRNPHWIYPGQVFVMPKGNTTWVE